MDLADAKRLKQLEEENRRLKEIVADQALNIKLLEHVNSKNGKPGAQETCVLWPWSSKRGFARCAGLAGILGWAAQVTSTDPKNGIPKRCCW